jgi:hypothetical protein
MNDRHHDNGSTIHSYSDHFLVQCPRCSGCSKSARVGKKGHITIARLTCTNCGYSKENETNRWYVGAPQDWFFRLPLWLQCHCQGNLLWAHNLEHLAYIESYVSASHRLRKPDSTAAIRNATMASRFPRWMILAKNREAILQGIKRLRDKGIA